MEKLDKALIDSADELRALVDHASDELDEGGTAFDLFVGILGGEDTTDTNDDDV